MKREDLRSLTELEKCIVNRKKDVSGVTISWQKCMWLRYERAHPGMIQFKYTHNEDVQFSMLDVNKRARGHRPQQLGVTTMRALYPEGREIASAKVIDLLGLLPFIPPIHHTFYLNLKRSDGATDHGLEDDSDDESSIE